MPDPYDPNQAMREKNADDVLEEHGFQRTGGPGGMDALDTWERVHACAEALRPLADRDGSRKLLDDRRLSCGCLDECQGHPDNPYPRGEGVVDEERGPRTTKLEAEVDNWQHRSAEMRCRTCMFYVPKGREGYEGNRAHIGRCRHSAPTLKGWPAIYPTDWCGAHKLDETKI